MPYGNNLNEQTMKNIAQFRSYSGKFPLLFSAFTWVCLTFASPAKAGPNAEPSLSPPSLPAVCGEIDVLPGYSVSAHVYAFGVQVYQWDGNAWAFLGPEATLSADPCFHSEIGFHYATSGPTWEFSDGGKVVAMRDAVCTPLRGAIPWLRLAVVSAPEEGRLANATFVQRVNTVGGTAPAEPGDFVGDEARVPYTAEYYFYRPTQH